MKEVTDRLSAHKMCWKIVSKSQNSSPSLWLVSNWPLKNQGVMSYRMKSLHWLATWHISCREVCCCVDLHAYCFVSLFSYSCSNNSSQSQRRWSWCAESRSVASFIHGPYSFLQSFSQLGSELRLQLSFLRSGVQISTIFEYKDVGVLIMKSIDIEHFFQNSWCSATPCYQPSAYLLFCHS